MFSLPKLLVLVLIILAVLYGFKLMGSLNERRARNEKEEPRPRTAQRERERERLEAEDLVPCPRCGAYVTPGGEHECRRKA